MELAKYKICPECGKNNPPNLFECKYCEADLTSVKVFDSSAERTNEKNEKVETGCTDDTLLVRICDCGQENAPQSRKCKACGEDISDIIPVRREKTEKKVFSYELKSYDGGFSAIIDKPLLIIGRDFGLKDYLQTKVYVSRQHAKLTVVSNRVFIENLSHTNKTFLNNKEIPEGIPVEIKEGDEIGLGGKVINESRQDKAAYFIFHGKV